MFYPWWGSLLADETSLAVWGLQGSPGPMLDSTVQQGIARTPWEGGWRPELVHLGLTPHPSFLQLLQCSAAVATLLSCAGLGAAPAQGSAPRAWPEALWGYFKLSADHLCNQCQIK